MIAFDGTASAAASATVRGAALLVMMDFVGGALRLTTWGDTITVGSDVYTAAGTLLSVSPLGESQDTKTDQLSVGLTVTNAALLAIAVGSAATYRNRLVTIYLQLMDATFQRAGAPVLRWSWVMDKIRITRDSTKLQDGSNGGKIEMLCSRYGMSRIRNHEGLRVTHAQQLVRFPGDLGLEFVATLVETPARWLSKKFQNI